jgi:hypothetical protein
MARTVKKLVLLVALATFGVAGVAASLRSNPLANWRPAQGASPAGIGYVGSAACAPCHAREAEAYAAAPMARASESAADSEILAANPRMTFREGPYTYEVARRGGASVYTVSDGARSISEPILYCFGRGVSGQTYLFRHGGALYESRVSYFARLKGLGVTILHPREVPKSLEAALGRKMSEGDTRGCFACHMTPAAGTEGFRVDRLAHGVGCESCHGPGERHLAAVRDKEAKEIADPQIFDPRDLDALDLTQSFCGACHMSFEKVMLMPNQGGLNNIRFQPYRAFKSGAHFVDDRRVSCVACHDPHAPTAHGPVSYDAKCLACHVASAAEPKTAERSAKPCPTATKECVTCHMPKVELPEMHAKFTDHWIRIARPGEPVPN